MSRSLSLTIPALVALYAVGAVWGASEGFASFGDAVLNGTYVNAPLPIIALQVLGGVAALRGSRIGAVVALLPCTVSLAAVAFDGDLGHSGLDAGHVAYQVTITAVTLVTWVALVARLRGQAAFGRAAGSAARSA